MTLTSKTNTQANIKTLANLSTRKRTLMALYNPNEIHKADWFVHIHVFGLSFVYFSLTTETATVARVPDTLETMRVKADMINAAFARNEYSVADFSNAKWY